MVKNLALILSFVAMSFVLKGQDIHFTQYYFSPLNTNPAHTGAFDGDYRVVGNYRSQWGAVVDHQFVTTGLSYDQNLSIYNHKIAVGINFVSDKSSIGALKQNKLHLVGSYKKDYKGHEFSAGLQFGLLHKGIDFTRFTFPDQYDQANGNFSTNVPNTQSFENTTIYNFDLNLGVSWGKQINKKVKPVIGFTLMHLNSPSESFLDNKNNSFLLRKVVDVKVIYDLNSKTKLIPNILFMNQNKAQELVWGAIVRYKVAANKYKLFDIFGGISSRQGFGRNYDAFTLLFGGKIKEYQLGISYDLNMSNLSSVSHFRGAFELSLIYIAKSTKSKTHNVPCDRL